MSEESHESTCFECGELLFSHSKQNAIDCIQELSEKLELVLDIFELKKIESEVDSLSTDTSDSHAKEGEQHE